MLEHKANSLALKQERVRNSGRPVLLLDGPGNSDQPHRFCCLVCGGEFQRALSHLPRPTFGCYTAGCANSAQNLLKILQTGNSPGISFEEKQRRLKARPEFRFDLVGNGLNEKDLHVFRCTCCGGHVRTSFIGVIKRAVFGCETPACENFEPTLRQERSQRRSQLKEVREAERRLQEPPLSRSALGQPNRLATLMDLLTSDP